jgi:exonuclease SbcD
MRLLHTSDWHVGRNFHGRSLLADQEAVLAAIADLVVEHEIDVVLMAGDLYDRAVPSVDAIQLTTRAFRRIREAGAEIVVSTGNHDSATRLGAFAEFLAAGGLHIRSAIDQLADPVLLADEFGEVAIYGIPYLEPDIARQVMAVPQVRGHAGVLGEAMTRIRADLADRPAATRSVVLAHAFVIGGSATESERCIDSVGSAEPSDALFEFKRGTVGSVPAEVFRGVDYVALGHLHRRQRIAPDIRYSGSPLPYSFSEAGPRKGCWLVDLDAEGLRDVTAIDLPVIRPLAKVAGSLTEILNGYSELRGHYLAFELTDPERPVEPMRQLVERFPFAVKLDWQPAGRSDAGPDFQISRQGLPDVELIDAFLVDSRGTGLSATEKQLVGRALTQVRVAEAAA